ncbi:hypothetical protein PHOSAC3_50023 [Mesotoga infera]|nr:hypothetical protein PHOSAC3_50023 [Mesotoga infera]
MTELGLFGVTIRCHPGLDPGSGLMRNVIRGSRWRVRKSKRNWLIVERFSVIRKDYGRLERNVEILNQVQNDCM